MKLKTWVSLALLLAIGIVLQIIEPQLPLPVLGVKLGLANIVGILAMRRYGYREMLTVNLLRVLLASLLRGTIFGTGFWLSLSGVLLSTLMVIAASRLTKLSTIGLCILSSAAHCLGQILAICVIWSSIYLIGYLPVMWLLSVPTGMLTGYLSDQVLNRLPKEA